MKATRYSSSRQKSCQSCSAAKAKCDRKAGRCTRCVLRDLPCSYPQDLPSRSSPRGTAFSPSSIFPTLSLEGEASAGACIRSPTVEPTEAVSHTSPSNGSSATCVADHAPNHSVVGVACQPTTTTLDVLDFSGLELFSPIDVDGISNRWLNTYIPVPGQKLKEYPAEITAFIYRLLKSYVALVVRGRGVPPFVHPSQVLATSTRPPLSTCLSLVRICEKPLPGSEGVAADVLQREMSNLYEQQGTYDDITLLAAFQAYLIYSMVLFFRLGQIANPFLRQAMMNLQELACSSSRGGLMCVAEQQRARPRWESWIAAEAKRRTMYVMYLFDSTLSTQDGLQTFLGTELRGLPAPADKSLWTAKTRHDWGIAYNIYLADWLEEGLRIDELWPVPEDMDESNLRNRRNRVDHWLENIDEFGTMIYAVTSCTHGG